MSILILFYSRTGNNRVLARHLAGRLGATLEEVKTRHWYPFPRVIWNMRNGRRPAVHPLRVDLAAFDHVLVLGPLWDMHVAFPLAEALHINRAAIGRYAFVSLCGYLRDGQPEAVRVRLVELLGHPPVHQMELHVGDLVAEADRSDVRKVSGRRVIEDDLATFDTQIATISGWFARG
jgi:hypothetical protein